MATATVLLKAPSEQTTRRTALAQLATGATIAALSTAAMATEIDPHPEWWRQRKTIRDWINGAGDELPDEVADLAFEHGCELEDQIASAPAATLAGVHAQIAIVLHSIAEVGSTCETDVAALQNAIATLGRLTGEILA
jgi:hypothetical protein